MTDSLIVITVDFYCDIIDLEKDGYRCEELCDCDDYITLCLVAGHVIYIRLYWCFILDVVVFVGSFKNVGV